MSRSRAAERGTSSGCAMKLLLSLHPSYHVLALSSQKESTLAKFALSGAVAWVYELGIGHTLEFLKIKKQVKDASYPELFREITAKKGLIGCLDGFFPWGTIQAIAKGAVFGGAHAYTIGQLIPLVDSGRLDKMTAEVIAGGVGGGFQGLVLSPTLLLKTRVMTDPVFRQEMSMWETTVQSGRVGMKVMRNEGFMGLMKGSLTFSLKRVADWGTRFLFAELAEDFIYRRGDATRKLTNLEAMNASLVGGVISGLVTLPIDVMVAQIQQASKAGQKVSVVETFRQQFNEGGWNRVAGFATKGFLARTAHVALTTALMKTLTGVVYEMVYGPKPKPAPRHVATMEIATNPQQQ